MTVHRFNRDSAPATPWKNGGGSTREIACWPPGATLDDFEWRVSIATIAASGPFSVFPGVDRTIMLLDGDGMRLKGDGVHALLDTPYEPFEFSGDEAVECTLLGGASTDFNVMCRRERWRAEVAVVQDLPVLMERGNHGLVLSLDGNWRVSGSLLTEGQGVWGADEAHTWRLEPASRGCRLITVRWTPPSDF